VLIISRKLNESILIGDDIRIMVTRLKGCDPPAVCLGIDAPPYVKILRSELIDRDKPKGDSQNGNE